jgi:Putative DNA-binding domain
LSQTKAKESGVPLAERQAAFAAAVLDAGAPVPQGLVGPDGEPSARRFAVYRNNVVAGLSESMKITFPAVARIVGEEFFMAMARAYVVTDPPHSPMLLEYGSGFPDFIERFPPAQTLPYLADVARIENGWKEAFHAPEAAPLPPAALATIPQDRLAELRLRLHPSVRLVTSRYPALTIWRMNVEGGVPAPVDVNAGGEDALVVRPAANVEVRFVPPGGVAFIRRLGEGAALDAAANAGLAASEAFDLSASLAGLISAGAFSGYDLDSEPAA